MKIYSFPHLVIYELMKHFEPVNLICLSFCSKKAHAFVKTFSKIEGGLQIQQLPLAGYDLKMSNLSVMVISETMKSHFAFPALQTHRGFEFFLNASGVLFTSWEDVVFGCRWTTNYICDLFKIHVAIVTVKDERDFWILDFVKQRQEQGLKKVFTHDIQKISEEDYSKIISSNATEDLYCPPCPPHGYRFDGNLPPAKVIVIRSGRWITREQLLGLQSQILQVWESDLTSEDINALLKCWLKGGLPNLKFLHLAGVRRNNTTYAGLVNRLERVQGEIIYKCTAIEAVRFDLNAFHIRREDGVVATVNINIVFAMVVWPDVTGKCV